MRAEANRQRKPLAGSARSERRFLEPEFGPRWESRWSAVLENLRAALMRAPGKPHGAVVAYFRDTWVESRSGFPARAMLASLAAHAAIVFLPLPIWEQTARVPEPEYRPVETVIYLPPRDLPPIRPPSPPGKSAAGRRAPAPEVEPPPLGADAFHPRQTIVARPLRPTHPRQTLIQPDAPPEAPKILPQLPNIVEWSESPSTAAAPAPRRVAAGQLSAHQLRAPAGRRPDPGEITAPVVASVPQAGELPLAMTTPQIEKPKLAVSALAGSQAGPARISGAGAGEDSVELPGGTPDIAAADRAGRRLIALSATPAPPSTAVPVPLGNLEANLTISPTGSAPGVPWGVPGGTGSATESGNGTGTGTGGAGSGPGEGGDGPPGIRISGDDPGARGPAVAGPERPAPARPLPARPQPRLDLSVPDRTPPTGGFEPLAPGVSPEQILGPKRIYTLHVNMPNLTSMTGSWVLRFAELDPLAVNARGEPGDWRAGPAAGGNDELSGPVPVRKVDPRYPPVLAGARIEGEVVLYAIIRADGTVDSIQLIRGLDPQLDQNAMEALARWKFTPARRNGSPVELEAVVTIPFRATAPL